MIKRELADLCRNDEEFFACVVGGGSDEVITKKLQNLNAGEYIEREFSINPQTNGFEGIDAKEKLRKNRLDTTRMLTYIETLRTAGYDIGRGNAEFGYRMPLPDKDDNQRVLQIFRRR